MSRRALIPGDRICRREQLIDGGRGVCFDIVHNDGIWPAFVVRYRGTARAYKNRCPHQGHPLDWNEAIFFDAAARFLMCASHLARYDAASGACAGGPCGGAPLTRVPVEEHAGFIVVGSEE